MKKCRRWIAAILSVCLLASDAGICAQAHELPDTVQLEGQMEEREAEEKKGSENSEKAEAEKGSENSEKAEAEKGSENSEKAEAEKGSENSEKAEAEKGSENTEENETQQGTVNFVMQESSYIQTPGSQNVVVSLGQEGTSLNQARLFYRNTGSGEEFSIEAASIAENMARFSIEYNSDVLAGIYELIAITYQAGGQNYRADLDDFGMEVRFGVNQQAKTEPDQLIADEELLSEVEASVVRINENGETSSDLSVEDAIRAAGPEGAARSAQRAAKAPKSMVIVLDPGHDSVHAGARGNGCKEEEIVFKIAQYCMAELKKYSGVSVFMTRSSNACPNGGNSVPSTLCNLRRVEFAVQKKADVYVSFHLNSSEYTGARGVGVYYPNGSYRPDLGAEGKGLATEIYKKLSALGLSTWAGGILIRNSQDNSLYPDGSLADYLSVIKNSKLNGIPAVLIEHAFLSNASDVSGFLNSEQKIKNLGIADAKGIASYYNLTERGDVPQITWSQSRNSNTLRICWDAANGAVSYQVLRSISENGNYVKVADVRQTLFDDKTVRPGATYYYKIRAVFSGGKVSESSAPYSGKTLAAPKISSVVSKSGSKLKVSWKPVEGAERYDILRSNSLNGSYTIIATQAAAANNVYMDQNLKTQKNYYYKIQARGGDQNGFSSHSSAFSGWVIGKTSITSVISNTSTSLRIRWKKVGNAYGYRIQRSTKKRGSYKTVGEVIGNKNIYIDKKLKPKRTYYYKVQAINRVNNKIGYSGYCSPKSGNTVTGTSISYVKSNDSSSMELEWKKVPNAYAYSIKRSTKKNGTYEKIAEIRDCGITQYIDKNIVSGKRYYYTVETIVKKKGAKHYSGDSAPMSAINLQKVSIASMQAGKSGITLNWEFTPGATCYQIMRSTKKKSGFAEIAKVRGSKNVSYTDKNVKKGARYFYRIRAIRTGKNPGYGSYGKVAEKWMLAAPGGLTARSVGAAVSPDDLALIQLSWNPVAGAAGYVVLRSTKQEGDYEIVASINDGQASAYTDTGVLPGVMYYYKVAALANEMENRRGEETVAVSVMIPTREGRGR